MNHFLSTQMFEWGKEKWLRKDAMLSLRSGYWIIPVCARSSCHIVMDAILQRSNRNCCVPWQHGARCYNRPPSRSRSKRPKIPLCGPLIPLSFIIFIIIDLGIPHLELLFVQRIPRSNGRTEIQWLAVTDMTPGMRFRNQTKILSITGVVISFTTSARTASVV